MGVLPRFDARVFNGETVRPIVKVSGEIDMATAPQLADAVATALAADPVDLVLDLADTTFLDCSAVAVIVSARNQLASESRLVLRHPQPIARIVLEVTHTDAFCTVED
jgi:anti-sigma B factor antagonist